MSKMGCNCGSVIYDYDFPLPFKGRIIRDQQVQNFVDRIAEDIAQFIKAKLNGKQHEWIARQFTEAYAKADLTDEEIVDELVITYIFKNCLQIYQCEICSRVLIASRNDPNEFHSFLPDSEDSKDLLSLETEPRGND